MGELGALEVALQGGVPSILGLGLWVVWRRYTRCQEGRLADAKATAAKIEGLMREMIERDRDHAQAVSALTEAMERMAEPE